MNQILMHALEHLVVEIRWEPCAIGDRLTGDLYFTLHHRQLVWSCFQEMRNLKELTDLLYAQMEWRWKAPADLLLSLKDLPLNPQIAYALSFLGPEPIGFETFMGLTELEEEETARLLLSLWALGGLELIQGQLPFSVKHAEPAPPSKRPEPVASAPPPAQVPPPVPKPPPAPVPPPVAKVLPPPAPAPLLPPPPAKEPRITIELAHEEEEEKIDFAVGGVLPPRSEPGAVEAEDDEGSTPVRNARRLFNKAKILIMQERASEAIRALEQSLKLDPDSPKAFEAWLLLGKLRLGNPAWSTRAIEALQAASRLQSKSAEPWALMGELYLRKGFKANALGCFKKAIELDPSVPIPPELNLAENAGEIKEPATLMSRLGTGLKAMLKKDKD
jgi:tetratricopeptide (TPR) repeat protein